MDDVARAIGMDPIGLRVKTVCARLCRSGYGHHLLYKRPAWLSRSREKYIGWDEKRKAYANQTGNVRRGVGMAMFSYKTGVYPISLETASARLVLNQDGTAQLQMGATEIGQARTRCSTQMAAETIGFSRRGYPYRIDAGHRRDAVSDTGAYASRQTLSAAWL